MSAPDGWDSAVRSSPTSAVPSDPAVRRRRLWLALVVLVWGAQAIVTQSLLLREAMVLMFGSEFAWGVVLFAWLLGVAIGAAIGGRAAELAAGRWREIALVVVLLALSLAACAELWVFRGARAWLRVGPGELLPLPTTALAAVLFVTPTSALIGMAFPLACCVGAVRRDENGGRCSPYLSFGQVYALEAAGSLVGGAAFSFWAVEHLSPIQTALLCGALNTAVCAAWIAGLPRPPHLSRASAREAPPEGIGRERAANRTTSYGRQARQPPYLLAGTVLAIVGLGAGVVAISAGDALNRRLVERRWRNVAPGYELVAEAESRYQNLAIGARAEQYTLYCDGHVSADFPDPYTFAPLAHFWLCQQPAPRRVLVLGGGAEGLIGEVLRHPVERVDYVETDPRQIELVRPFVAEVDRQALRDPRVAVHYVDARYYVKTQRDRFDLVIARLPEPTSALRARFYTDEFFGELRRAMSARAVLCLTTAAAPNELPPRSREYLASVRATLHRHFRHIVVGWGDPAQVLAATAPGLISTDPGELAARYAQRGVESAMFDPAWFAGATDWLAAEKVARRAADLDRADAVQVSTDLRPAVYLQRLVLWEATTGSSRFIEWLRSVRLGRVVGVLGGLAGVLLLASRIRAGTRAGWASGAVSLSVATTGFATMALSILWLFAFQNLYGYVYQRIGWIIALFMGGLVLGCMLATQLARPWRRLIAVDVLLAALALSVPFVVPALAALPSGPGVFLLVEGCISILVVATGLLGGAAFAYAARLQLEASGRPGAAAGTIVGADHAGACLGALLCGILLVPVFGTAATAYVLAGMKLVSAALLIMNRRLAGYR